MIVVVVVVPAVRRFCYILTSERRMGGNFGHVAVSVLYFFLLSVRTLLRYNTTGRKEKELRRRSQSDVAPSFSPLHVFFPSCLFPLPSSSSSSFIRSVFGHFQKLNGNISSWYSGTGGRARVGSFSSSSSSSPEGEEKIGGRLTLTRREGGRERAVALSGYGSPLFLPRGIPSSTNPWLATMMALRPPQ